MSEHLTDRSPAANRKASTQKPTRRDWLRVIEAQTPEGTWFVRLVLDGFYSLDSGEMSVEGWTSTLPRRWGCRPASHLGPDGRVVYRAYVAGYRTDALIASDLAAVLRSHSYLNWDTFDARYNASAQAVTRFRISLIEYAAVNHLRLPRWVHSIGGK